MIDKKIIIGIIVIALVLIGVLLMSLGGGPSTVPGSQSTGGEPETVEEIQLDPPDDYIQRLKDIIDNDPDPYARETALLALTEIALREDDTEEIMDYLKDLAMEEEDENVRTSAYVSIDLIRDKFPLEPKGSLQLTVDGELKTGEAITLIATVSSTVAQETAIVAITSLDNEIKLVSDKGTVKFPLNVNEPKEAKFDLKLKEAGEYTIPVTFMLSFDRIDYEKVKKEIVLEVV